MTRALLSVAQERALRRLIASRDTPQYIVTRAQHVLAESNARAAGAPRPAETSRKTGAKWLARYLDLGVEGLHDAPRQGRPSTTDDEDVLSVLAAPLYADSSGWTTRSVAAQVGLSQSAVARTWRRVYRDDLPHLTDVLPSSPLVIEASYSGPEGSVLIVGRDTSAPAPPGGDFMRSPLRPPLQVLLATDIIAEGLRRDEAATPALLGFSRAVADLPAKRGVRVALCSSTSISGVVRTEAPDLRTVDVAASRWQGLLIEVGARVSPQQLAQLLDVQQRARDWARLPQASWSWVRSTGVPSERPSLLPRRYLTNVATGEKVTHALFSALYGDIMAGRLAAGDRVTETSLARATHISRGHVRDGLKVLASREIVRLEPNRGAVVPSPTIDDVVEIYAARRSLGALLVRRAAEAPVPGHLPVLESALAAMLATAAQGDALETGELDLRLQELLGEMAGMQRIASMYTGLNDQLRMLVAVLRIRYAYSIPDMCRDNQLLVEHIRERRGGDAVAAWNAKMNDAANYMIRQLEPPNHGVTRRP